MFTDYALPPEALAALSAQGITTPTPIQTAVLPVALEGRDVLGRARTGTGKTLAFALPIAARLEPSRERGRRPRAIILAPTRELARQSASVLEWAAPKLDVLAVYGGAAYSPQERSLERGTDVIVGTPGRIIDHLDRGKLNLSDVQMVVLDEADEMLSMGFEEAVERILRETPPEHQTLLLSATLPDWVNRLAAHHQKNPERIDLVAGETAVVSTTQNLAVRVAPAGRTRVLADLLTVLAPERAIVFTRTRKDTDDLALELVHRGIEADAIHGDLAQAQRERALGAFRSGKTRVLVATDVAARGLDIPEVDLVVQTHVPQDAEAYIHRSGRTGRAGRAGTAIVLYTDREFRSLRFLERETGIRFEQRGAPTAREVREASAANAAGQARAVPAEVLDAYMEEARRLYDDLGLEGVAAALACIAGVTAPAPAASLITGEEGLVTLLLHGERLGVSRAVAWMAGQAGLESRVIGKVRAFEGGVAADVPTASVEAVLNASGAQEVTVERATSLPDLIEVPRAQQSRYEGNRGGNRGGGRYEGNRGRNFDRPRHEGGDSRPSDGPRNDAPRGDGRSFDRPRQTGGGYGPRR
ncbi:MAG TPA: DEAD/DEAH box helicase, partial [Deinococcales bacterium]|nr:DEAD/DEAH box helicase [Deinococcales bacterium]